MTSDGPKPTGKVHEDVTVTGKLFPWNGQQPVLLSMPGSDLLYLPLFTTEDQLRDVMARAQATFVSIKQVQDGPEFLSGLYESWECLRVILDPYFLPNGRLRFVQVQLRTADLM